MVRTCSASFSTIRELAILELVAERHHAADPEPFALGGGDLVADAFGRDLALELGERQQHVEGQTAHRGGGIELLGHRDERHAMGIEQFDQLGKVRQRARQPVDLVDHDDIDLARFDVGQQALQGRPVG